MSSTLLELGKGAGGNNSNGKRRRPQYRTFGRRQKFAKFITECRKQKTIHYQGPLEQAVRVPATTPYRSG
jgi:hypothetical protein